MTNNLTDMIFNQTFYFGPHASKLESQPLKTHSVSQAMDNFYKNQMCIKDIC